MNGDDEDELWLLQAIAVMMRCSRGVSLGCLLAKYRLFDQEGDRFFEKIYSSANKFLFRDHFRMEKHVYDKLYAECGLYIPAKIKYRREVFAVTLDWLGRSASCHDQETKFGLAYSTVHRYRRAGLYAIIKGLAAIVKMPTVVPSEFVAAFPYFDQALTAIDGVHIPVMVSMEDGERFRNRKVWISTNVLVASDWQLNVAFIYPGAKVAAHDSMVLAHSKFLQTLPEHMYVLADAGYGLHPQVLTPYRGVRYHLKEFAEDTDRPQSGKELFNLRHTKARNVVERLNGCLKRRFKILRIPIECEVLVAKAVIFACACLYDFIRYHDSQDLAEAMAESGDSDEEDEEDIPAREEPFPFDFKTPINWRDWIASAMWTEYKS